MGDTSLVSLNAYNVYLQGGSLPEVDQGSLYDYVFAANGTYVRGKRVGLEVCFPTGFTLQHTRGLEKIESYVKWGYPRVPRILVETILKVSQAACVPGAPREALYYLHYDESGGCPDAEHIACAYGWHVIMPEQGPRPGFEADTIRPVHTGPGTPSARAIIELHSHHNHPAIFSEDDDTDEVQGFRVYMVIGTIFTSPMVRARIGMIGHFWEHPATTFFDLPEGLNDCVPG